ncbi:MAG: RsmE family RNA methyltransferase, partial [Coriobacteriales bacterium]|nr:RsmE family RNA methyltransferase [Coriobacteriales bacterium]
GTSARVAAVIGPEGGFSEAEAACIRAAGGHTITMGSTILRTETAAVVACALILYHLGGLGACATSEAYEARDAAGEGASEGTSANSSPQGTRDAS